MEEKAFALGLGVGTMNKKGEWLEIFFPNPILNPSSKLIAAIGSLDSNSDLSQGQFQSLASSLKSCEEEKQLKLANKLRNSPKPTVAVLLTHDVSPANVPEAYLKLHLLSHRLVKPHETNLEGIFGVLPNVAWTSEGAIDLLELPERQFAARLQGEVLEVSCVDKFPKMTNYVVPGGVRIAHTARVRLGAYIGEGTTIMHEGFVNFNAGCEGPNMIEGRISAGVMVGAGSDLGGGCSTIGTLSGGGNIVISVGEKCLIGANAGTGIPLGDRCTIEAGLFVTAGTKVHILDKDGEISDVTKARNLAGKNDLLFRRCCMSGAVECLTNKSAAELNAELHTHN